MGNLNVEITVGDKFLSSLYQFRKQLMIENLKVFKLYSLFFSICYIFLLPFFSIYIGSCILFLISFTSL